jgi:hypothetical protein
VNWGIALGNSSSRFRAYITFPVFLSFKTRRSVRYSGPSEILLGQNNKEDEHRKGDGMLAGEVGFFCFGDARICLESSIFIKT